MVASYNNFSTEGTTMTHQEFETKMKEMEISYYNAYKARIDAHIANGRWKSYEDMVNTACDDAASGGYCNLDDQDCIDAISARLEGTINS